jgi:hypothetical protein
MSYYKIEKPERILNITINQFVNRRKFWEILQKISLGIQQWDKVVEFDMVEAVKWFAEAKSYYC